MRKDKDPVRKSGMDDADLSRRCDEMCQSFENDLAELGAKNITQDQIDALRTQRKAFEDLPSDAELLAEQKGKEQGRDITRADLELAISQVAGCAADEWGYDSPQYDRFGVKEMDEMDDPTLLRAAHSAHRAGNKLLGDLAGQGLTAAMVADIATKAEAFRGALDEFDDAINDRAEGARTRILDHNTLYDALSAPAKRAQRHYKPRNATKYGQYVLGEDDAAGKAGKTPAVATP